MLGFLQRSGEALFRSRTVAARLDPKVNGSDVWPLIAILVVGSEMPAIGQVIARLAPGVDWGNGLMILATLGHVFLPPVLLLWLCEILLGRGRDHARSLCLVPFVAIVVVAHTLRLLGVLPGTPTWIPQLVGACAAAGLALWIRPAVRVSSEGQGS